MLPVIREKRCERANDSLPGTVQINVSFRARPPTAGLADQLTFAGSEALGSCCMHPSYAWKPASRWCLTASTSASSRTST